ncbi:hypothetical protein BD626DRAFT_551122 [Schizophyllum amplum]|uniref:Transaldolase n=1 Tax=Schizophyllum amplum TaxID=97359 RepID=A0A550BYD6_9AGAR|nr:hypothetical protein BD626DRAFT_551122 [Auriculariopsis ampla]
MDPSFCDMTSNQVCTPVEPGTCGSREKAITHVLSKGTERTSESFAMDVIDVATVLLAQEVYPYLTGNVHAQTSPSTSYDTEKDRCAREKTCVPIRRFRHPEERVCIKIPSPPSPPSRARSFRTEASQTLGTCLFSLPQAIASSQAGCTYVAPYFNELRVHFEPTINSKTLVMPASIVTAKEHEMFTHRFPRPLPCLLTPAHLTISGGILDQLAVLPEVSQERLTAPPVPSYSADLLEVQYLADNAAKLKDALASDAETTRKLADALKLFDECEKKTKEYILAFQQ